MQPRGDAVNGRIPLMGNTDVIWFQAVIAEQMKDYYKNAEGDELLFIHDGSGVMESMYGNVAFFSPGDYLVISRGTIYRLVFDQLPVRMIAIESHGPCIFRGGIETRSGSSWKMLLTMSEIFDRPSELITHNERAQYFVQTKARGRIIRYE